ncbi:hypothetical protein [Spirulina sp. 06S082]|uniref:hypothetical protein n=1 Tax=Spirulina sp. 06S082 TaxID=3110248 RepID=UPI002B1F0E8B|nr:hypothetical protein [Spirulina sp. 06S082]MEA5467995.1 hypothetical protein [Spirulina sp. 06S082]
MPFKQGDWVLATFLENLDPQPKSAFGRIIDEKEKGVFIIRILYRYYDPPYLEVKKKIVSEEDCKRLGMVLVEREKEKLNLWSEHYRRWRSRGLYSPELKNLKAIRSLWL